jgi:hypothetical protein
MKATPATALAGLALLVASGCGGGNTTGESSVSGAHVAALARDCHESESAVTHYLDTSLKTLRTRGYPGSEAKLAGTLDKLARHVRETGVAPNCKRLLESTEIIVEEPKTAQSVLRTSAFLARANAICVKPPARAKALVESGHLPSLATVSAARAQTARELSVLHPPSGLTTGYRRLGL